MMMMVGVQGMKFDINVHFFAEVALTRGKKPKKG
jgi:hypothetical protein